MVGAKLMVRLFEARPGAVPTPANDNDRPTDRIRNVGFYTVGVAAWMTLAWTAGLL